MLGHYGNPICTFEANIRDPTDVDEFKVFLLKRLPEVERLSIVSELDKHSDSDGNLYIRIDKQKMYQGKARSGHDDPIRVRMKFSRFAGKASTLMTEYLESG
jgi:RNA binding exosome subunit